MSGVLHVSTNKNQSHVTVNPVNNINVNVGDRTVESNGLSDLSACASPDLKVKYQENANECELLKSENEALKIIIDMMRSNPISVNKLIIADDKKLELLVKLLTNSDEVHIDAEDIGSGCFTTNTYRKVNAIYVIKNGNTKNLKYDYPEVTRELKDLGINIKLVW